MRPILYLNILDFIKTAYVSSSVNKYFIFAVISKYGLFEARYLNGIESNDLHLDDIFS